MTSKSEEQFIQTNPNSYITYMVIGDYHQKNEAYKKAIELYTKALTYSVSSIDEEYIIKEKIVSCKNKLKE